LRSRFSRIFFRPPAVLALALALAGPATAVAPDHRDLERQVEALMTLHEAALVLEEEASREGAYPEAADWDELVAGWLAPAGLVGVPRRDPWGAPYLYRVTEEGDRYLLASPGADGEYEGGRESLQGLLVAEPAAPPLFSDDPGGDLLFFAARASWCRDRCGFLRAPGWAGREWGGPLDWAPAADGTTGRERAPARRAASRCLAGEAASSWLTLREEPSPRGAEKGRLTSSHGPLRRSGAVRLRGTELWARVETSLGKGWVRARYLGPCEGDALPPRGAATAFEIDRLFGPAARALARSEAGALEALADPAGVILLPGEELLAPGELLARLGRREGSSEGALSARWTLEEEGEAGAAGRATPVRERATGLTLWFARREGRPVLVALSPPAR
jgi:hypothetical protein